MERKVSFAPGEYFHVYNRGTDKRNIFFDPRDYQRFIESLYLFNSEERIVLRDVNKKKRFSYERKETLVYIGAYCLMPNHFHLLIKSKNETGVSHFMKKLLTAYSMYFNKKYKRNGVLFQGPFKAEYASRDEYLKYLFAYIHLNPVKLIEPGWKDNGIKELQKAKDFIKSYKYTSYLEYSGGNRAESSILDMSVFPAYFSQKDFDNYMSFWLEFKNDFEKF